jgi:NodT family efflux transporter outer membrane factor (OMF) lipoprotein
MTGYRSSRRLFWLLLPVLGCAVPSAEVRVPEVQLPRSFADQPAASGPESRDWRRYFADEPLLGLISSAVQHNPDQLIALQRIEAARASVQGAKGALWPKVSLGAGASLRRFGEYTMDGAGNAATEIRPGQRVPEHLPDFSVGLQSSWEVDLWGKLRAQRDSALAAYLASIEGKKLVTTALVSEVAADYFELVALDHRRDVLAQTVARQQEALDVVRLQKQVGKANELAVRQFEAQLASTQALEVAAKARAEVLENQLNLLLGRLPRAVQRTADAQLLEIGRGVSAGVPARVLENRPDIRQAELLVEAARCDLQAARAAFFPRLDISAGVGYQAFNPRFLFSTPESLTYSAVAGLVAPLVNRSGIEAAFATAKARQLEALYNYQKSILEGYVDVVNGLAAVKHAAETVALRRAQGDAAAGTVDAADALYRAGKASYFEVLIAQQNTLSAELELIDASKRQRLASVQLYRALGGGWN